MSGETLDLDAIEARANAATPGPWLVVGPCGDCGRFHAAEARFEREVGEFGAYYASWHPAIDGCTPDGGREHDADFIAAARTDIPALVAEVRRLREALNEVLFYVTAGGPARMFGAHEMYDCLIEKSRVDGWRAAVGGEPR